MAYEGPFIPAYGNGVTITTSGTSQNVTIQKGTLSVRIQNTSATNGCFVRVFNSQNNPTSPASSTSPTADVYIGPNSYMTLGKGREDDTVSVIQAAGTAVLWIIPGEGGLL